MADLNWDDLSPVKTTSPNWDDLRPLGSTPTEPQGDTSRGFTRAFAQVPELAYGTGALASMAAEKLFGEGGLSTTAKNYFGEKFAAKQAENQKYAPTVEFTDAWDNLGKEPGKMVDWIQDSAGYVVGQGLQTIATGGLGAIAGRMTLGTLVAGSAAKAADKMVAAKVAEMGLTGEAAATMAQTMLPAATAQAARNLTTALGSGAVLSGQNLAMEAGDIYGGLIEESKNTGKEITGADVTRAWLSAGAAAGTETLTDMLGLGALTGRIKIGGKGVQEMTGVTGRLARAGTAAAIGMPVEGAQEWVQTGLEQYGAGKPLDTHEAAKERINAAAVGALGGGLMGGGIGAIQGANTADEAIRAAQDVAFSGATDAATAAIDAYTTGDMGPAALLGPPSAGPTLIAGAAGVGTPEQQAAFAAQQDAARLDAMTAPADVGPTGLMSSVPIVGQPTVTPDTSGGRTDTTGVRADDLLIPDIAQPSGEALVTPQTRVLSDIEAYQAAEQKQGTGALLSSYERAILDAGPPSTPDRIVPVTASTAEQGTAQRKLDREGSRPVPLTQQTLAQQESAAIPGQMPTSVGGTHPDQLDNEQLSAIIANPATHANTRRAAQAVLGSRMSQPRTPPTQGAQNGQGLQDTQTTPEAVAVKQVFGEGAQLRTASEAPQPGERVSTPMRAALTQIGRLTGTKVVFVSAEGADGATRSKDGNTVYINVRSSINPLQVLGHETTHVLKKKHREAWAAIRAATSASVDDAALAEFGRDYWGIANPERAGSIPTGDGIAAWLDQKPADAGVDSTEATVRDFLMDEIISDLGGERFSDPEFWGNVFQRIEDKHGTEQAKGIIQRLVAAVKELIAKFMIIAKRDGFAEFKTEGMIAQRVTPEQLREIQKAIESAYAGFISAERTNEPAGYVRAAATPATGAAPGTQGTQGDDELAALEAAQQSPKRTSDVGHKRTKSGDYVGAPVGMTSAKLGALRTRLRALADEGEQGRMWYEESGMAILEAAEGSIPLAEKIAGLLAIYSPSMTVSGNTTVGLKALYQWMNGQPIKAKTGVQDDKAQAWMDGVMAEEDALQIKTGNFFRNLMRKIDESRYGFEKQGATIDMWMARIFGYNSKAIGSSARYNFAEREVKRLATELGWEPQQVQAALWVAIKSRIESIASVAREYGQQQGWLKKKVSSTGNISWVPINAEARDKYEAHILKLAMATGADPKGLAGASYNFGTALEERVGQVSWEAMPGRTSGVLPGIFNAPLEQQVEYLVAMDAALRDENGNDIIAARLGLPVLYTNMGPSAWEGAVGAGAQTTVAVATDRDQKNKAVSVNPNARTLLNAYAAIRGYVLSQEAVVWHYPIFSATKKDANGVQIDIGRDPTTEETRQLYQAVRDAAGRTDWAPAYVPTVGWRILNFDENVSNIDFAKQIKSVLSSLPDMFPASEFKTFKSDGDYISNDWKENSNGEGYRSWISGAGRSDLQGWVEGDLRDRTRRVEEDFAERYGWGRPDAASSRPAGGSVASQSLPRYGAAADRHAVSVTGVHYSREQRDTLSSAYFGTGLKGQERLRVAAATDPRIKRRLYFYANTGRGISPEADVGIHAHAVGLDNVYDMDVDALRLYPPVGETYRSVDQRMNDFESAVLDAGYDGYMTREFGLGGAAVLLGDHSVPVQYEGAGARPDVAPTPAPQYSDLQKLRREIAANRALPSGRLSGLEWKRILMREMPEVDPRWLDNAEMYYKGDLLKGAEDTQRSEQRLAPNGKPSKLNAQQWAQVRTPAFKAWFGDWEKHARAKNPVGSLWSDDSVSKIVDENGEPLVVYHGTQQGGFDIFRPEKGDKNRSPMLFATADAGTARSYSGRPAEIEVQSAATEVEARRIGKEWYAIDKGGDGSYAYNVYGDYVQIEDAESYVNKKEAEFFINTDLTAARQDSGDLQRGIYHLFLNIKNPNEADFEGANWDGQRSDQYEVWDSENEENVYKDDGSAFMPEDDADALAKAQGDPDRYVVRLAGDHYETTNSVAEEALRMRQDGAIIRNVVDDGGKHGYGVDPSDVFVFFDSNQVKSATQNTGAFSRKDNSILRSESRAAPWYYSELARAVDNAPAKAFTTGKQFAVWIQSNSGKLGVKKQEIEATGITDWLQTRDRVTREDVAAYLEQGGVQLTETVLGRQFDPDNPTLPTGWNVVSSDRYPRYEEMALKFSYVVHDVDDMPVGWGNSEEDAIQDAYSGNPQYFESVDDTKFQQYVLPGGENYREWLLTLPTSSAAPTRIEYRQIDENGNATIVTVNPETAEKWRSQGKEVETVTVADELAAKKAGQFVSSHFDQPNILAHIRTNERTDADGRRVLFIEEIQGDWPQMYRKQTIAIQKAVDNDFEAIVARMEKDGVLEVNCD